MGLKIASGEDSVSFDVHVVPRASKSALVGEHDGCLKVALAAPPVDGAANRALIALFAQLLRVPRRDVQLVRGESSRRKTLRVQGACAADIEALTKSAET
jgi:uncharacterized protein (TIGR00251 family)